LEVRCSQSPRMALESDRVAMGLEGLCRRRRQGTHACRETGSPTWSCRTLASFCRLILFDRRGTGISDPLPPDPLPPWEAYAQELAAVLDEVGTERAALLAELDAGPTAIIFAATQPQRVRALVLSHATARFVAADDYPIGLPAEVAEAVAAQSDQLGAPRPWWR
jgi:pimeloyl-ACP methyl ester carboxylesterase